MRFSPCKKRFRYSQDFTPLHSRAAGNALDAHICRYAGHSFIEEIISFPADGFARREKRRRIYALMPSYWPAGRRKMPQRYFDYSPARRFPASNDEEEAAAMMLIICHAGHT